MTNANKETTRVGDILITLSKGPYTLVKPLKYYVINGLKFRSSNKEANRKI